MLKYIALFTPSLLIDKQIIAQQHIGKQQIK